MSALTEHTPPSAKEALTMNGKTTILEYLASDHDAESSDAWTQGYFEARRRIYRMLQQPINQDRAIYPSAIIAAQAHGGQS